MTVFLVEHLGINGIFRPSNSTNCDGGQYNLVRSQFRVRFCCIKNGGCNIIVVFTTPKKVRLSWTFLGNSLSVEDPKGVQLESRLSNPKRCRSFRFILSVVIICTFGMKSPDDRREREEYYLISIDLSPDILPKKV
jgi:hypothetical protein